MSIGEAIQKGIILLVIVFIVLFILYVGIIVFSKILSALARKETPASADTAPAKSAPVQTPGFATVSTAIAPPQEAAAPVQADATYVGSLRLKNTDEQTAAMIMAIVSDESGIALNELTFKSISLVEKGKDEEGQA